MSGGRGRGKSNWGRPPGTEINPPGTLAYCPKCHQVGIPKQTTKPGPNCGKLYYSCPANCQEAWIGWCPPWETVQPPPQSQSQAPPPYYHPGPQAPYANNQYPQQFPPPQMSQRMMATAQNVFSYPPDQHPEWQDSSDDEKYERVKEFKKRKIEEKTGLEPIYTQQLQGKMIKDMYGLLLAQEGVLQGLFTKIDELNLRLEKTLSLPPQETESDLKK